MARCVVYTDEDVQRAIRRATAQKDAEIARLRQQVEYLEKIVSGEIALQPPPPIILQVTTDEAKRVIDLLHKVDDTQQSHKG